MEQLQNCNTQITFQALLLRIKKGFLLGFIQDIILFIQYKKVFLHLNVFLLEVAKILTMFVDIEPFLERNLKTKRNLIY